MAVFDGVRYSLSPSLSPTRRNELAAILDLNGAAPHPPYTHLITLPASHALNNATTDSALKLVTDHWVDRSVVMGKRQSEQYYSPDPSMIFSGVVACSTELYSADVEVLSAGITALGGQWRDGLTRDVTHLFALRAGSDKYNTALHFAAQTHMCILTPHWFDDSVRLGRRIPETAYTWPDPPALRPGLVLDLDKDLATDGKRRRRRPADTEAGTGDATSVPTSGEHQRVWDGRRVLLSTSLDLSDGSRSAIEAGIHRAGGVVVPVSENADEVEEEKAVDKCDVFVTRWRSGKPYFKAARASLLIGTLTWLFSVESSGTLYSPLDSLLWYPTPKGGIPDLVDCEISVTNYTGATRDYLKRLIVLVGAKFTPAMSQSNKVLVAGFQPSPKTTRALSWSIPVVNHTWLEDCFVEWRALTVGLERYIVYPPGIDFGAMLMAQPAGSSSSQAAPAPRSFGGAVPGGRGIGVIDVDQEGMRDAEYHARMRKGLASSGPSKMHEALINDTTTDEISIVLEGNVPTEPGTRTRAESAKRTPSSTRRRGSISTPMAASAMGAFVDHVIELPSEAGEGNMDGKRRIAVTSKKSALASPKVTRARSRSMSRRSSIDSSRIEREVEVVVRDPARKSTDGEDIAVGAGDAIKDRGKRQTRPVQEAKQNEDGPSVPLPKPTPRPTHRRPSVRTEDEVVKQASTQSGRPPQRVKRMPINLDSDSGDGSEVSLPARRASGVGSATPVKSGMKPRPRSKSRSRPGSVMDGESGVLATKSRVEVEKQREPAKLIRRGRDVAPNGKDQARDEKGKGIARTRSPTHSSSSISPDRMASRTPKRRLSVLVPSVPKDYFSSQSLHETIDREKGADVAATVGSKSKKLVPIISMHAIAAEASGSTSKRGKPSPVRISTTAITSGKSKSLPKAKRKPDVFKEVSKNRVDDNDGDMNGDDEDDNTSIVASTGRGGLRRGAANKATARLKEVVMPDLVNFEREQKQAKRRRSLGGESVASVRDEEEDQERGKRGWKRRKVATAEEEDMEVQEAEVEVVLSVPSIKAKPTNGKGKKKGATAMGSDEDMEDLPAKNRPGRSGEKNGISGRGKVSTAIRLMTTGVSLSDDVVKRLTRLGVQMTMKPTDCTHLIAKGFVRTEKFLCAMSVSPYVLAEDWANASAKSGKLLVENDYLLSDPVAEQKWSFKFADAMARAKGVEGGPNLFKQMTFYVTPKVSVDIKLLKNVVSAGGGQVQTSTTPTARILRGKPNRYVVSSQEDKAIWRPLVQEGFKVYSPELVLRAALRQEIEWERKDSLVDAL